MLERVPAVYSPTSSTSPVLPRVRIIIWIFLSFSLSYLFPHRPFLFLKKKKNLTHSAIFFLLNCIYICMKLKIFMSILNNVPKEYTFLSSEVVRSIIFNTMKKKKKPPNLSSFHQIIQSIQLILIHNNNPPIFFLFETFKK